MVYGKGVVGFLKWLSIFIGGGEGVVADEGLGVG